MNISSSPVHMKFFTSPHEVLHLPTSRKTEVWKAGGRVRKGGGGGGLVEERGSSRMGGGGEN